MENGLSDNAIRLIIGAVSTVVGVLLGNVLNFFTNKNKQSTTDFDVITDKWEKLYANLEKHNAALEERVTELENHVNELIEINRDQLKELDNLRNGTGK